VSSLSISRISDYLSASGDEDSPTADLSKSVYFDVGESPAVTSAA